MEYRNTNFKMLNTLLSNTASYPVMFGNESPRMQENRAPTITSSNCHSIKKSRKRQKKVTFAENHQTFTKDSQVSLSTDDLAEALFIENSTDTEWNHSTSERLPSVMKKTIEDANVSSNNGKSHPIILKKRDQPHDPIKNLPFSPSRFLNPDSSSSQSDKEKVSKDLNLSLCSHPDDSGIETSSCESEVLFSKALTSTPICKRSQKRFTTPLKSEIDIVSPLKSITHLSESCFSEANTTLLKHSEHTSNDSGNETVFKTPVIRKYLNESVPRTPTPFKCESKATEENVDYSSIGAFSLESFSILKEDKPLPILGKFSPELMKFGENIQRYPPRSLKKARKSLLLDHDWMDNESKSPNKISIKEETPLATQLSDVKVEHNMGFIPFESPLSRSKIRVRNCSTLVDGGTIVESRKFSIGRKSFYTSHSEIVSRKEEVCKKWKSSMELNKKWVAIACGRSEDQKAMTLAAKNYLNSGGHMSNHKLTLSNAVLKRKISQSTFMR